MDVLDLNITISCFLRDGLREYVLQNQKSTIPTLPSGLDFAFLENCSREEGLARWHTFLQALADQFDALAGTYSPTQEAVATAFDGLKKVYQHLWI